MFYNLVQRCHLCNRLKPLSHIQTQVAYYRDPLMPTELYNHLVKRSEIKIPEDDQNDKTLRKKAFIWARYGKVSRIETGSLLPSKRWVEREAKAEKEWWPTFQEMKLESEQKEELERKQKLERERKVAENMAKMPEWISKWKLEQKKVEEDKLAKAAKQKEKLENAKAKTRMEIIKSRQKRR